MTEDRERYGKLLVELEDKKGTDAVRPVLDEVEEVLTRVVDRSCKEWKEKLKRPEMVLRAEALKKEATNAAILEGYSKVTVDLLPTYKVGLVVRWTRNGFREIDLHYSDALVEAEPELVRLMTRALLHRIKGEPFDGDDQQRWTAFVQKWKEENPAYQFRDMKSTMKDLRWRYL